MNNLSGGTITSDDTLQVFQQDVTNDGTIKAFDGGAFEFDHNVNGSGTLFIDGGDIAIAGQTGNSIEFGTHFANLGNYLSDVALGDAQDFSGQIGDFTNGDRVVVDFAFNSTTFSFSNGVVDLKYTDAENNVHHLLINAPGAADAGDFVLAPADYNLGTIAITGGTELSYVAPVVLTDEQQTTEYNDGSTTLSGLKIGDIGGVEATITAVADHGTLSLLSTDSFLNVTSDGSDGTLTVSQGIGELSQALSEGIKYTPTESSKATQGRCRPATR